MSIANELLDNLQRYVRTLQCMVTGGNSIGEENVEKIARVINLLRRFVIVSLRRRRREMAAWRPDYS